MQTVSILIPFEVLFHFPKKRKEKEKWTWRWTDNLLTRIPFFNWFYRRKTRIKWIKKKGRKIWSRGLELLAGSSKPNVTVIADAREASTPSPEPETHARFPIGLDRTPPWNTYRHNDEVYSPNYSNSESMPDQQESMNILVERNARVLRSVFPTCPGAANNSEFSEETVKGATAYPPFPCPFCDRAYTSWGFRRRHIKAVHTISPSLNCKWCLQVCTWRLRYSIRI